MAEVASLIARFSAEGDDQVVRSMRNIDRSMDDVGNRAESTGGKFTGMFKGMGGLLLGGALVGGVAALGNSLLSASADAETMRNSLNIAVGDTEAAGKIFKSVQDMSAATPFSFPELMESTVALESFGLSAEDWLTSIGDTAAGTGKGINQVTEAVLDVQTGSYERLKELGIATRVEGDKLTFSYMKNGKKIEQVVDRTNQELVNSTLEGIWNGKYEGAMEVQSRSFAGNWSTLKDNVMLRLQEMTTGVFAFATKSLQFLNDIFAKGWKATVADTFGAEWVDRISGALSTLGAVGAGALAALSGAGSLVAGAFDLIVTAWDSLKQPLADAFTAADDLAGGLSDAFDAGQSIETIMKRMPEPLRGVTEAMLNAADAAGDLWRGFEKGGVSEVLSRFLEEFAQFSAGLPGAFVDIATTFDREFWKVMDDIDWNGLGTRMGQGVRSLFLDLPGIVRENWQTIAKAFAVMVAGLPLFAFHNVKMLAPIAKDLIVGFYEGLDIQWGTVESFFRGMPGKIGSAIGGVAETLVQKGRNLLIGLGRGVREYWDSDVVPWFVGLPMRAAGHVGPDTLTSLVGKGWELIVGLGRGIREYWDGEVVPWLVGLPLRAAGHLGPDTLTALVAKGIDLIYGFLDGINQQWQFTSDAIASIPGRAVDAIGDTAMRLWRRGYDLMWGFAQGIESAGAFAVNAARLIRDTVIDILENVPGYSPLDHAGMELGQMLGKGFAEGIASMAPDAARAARQLQYAGLPGGAGTFGGSIASPTRYTPSLSPVRVARSSGGGGSVVYDLRGSIVGGDVVRFVDERVATGAKKLVDIGYSRNRMQEAR